MNLSKSARLIFIIHVTAVMTACSADVGDLFTDEGGGGTGGGAGGGQDTSSSNGTGAAGSGGGTGGGSVTTGSGGDGTGGDISTSTSNGCIPAACTDNDLCGLIPDGCGGWAQCQHACSQASGPNYCNDVNCPPWNTACNDDPDLANACVGCVDPDPALACAGVQCGHVKDRCGLDIYCPYPGNPQFPNGCANYQACVEDQSDPTNNQCFGCQPYDVFPDFCQWSTPKPFEYKCGQGFGSSECEYYPGPGIWCCEENEIGCRKDSSNPIWNNSCNNQLIGSTVVTCPDLSLNNLSNCQKLQPGVFCCNGEPL
jgi:hypothetical protein